MIELCYRYVKVDETREKVARIESAGKSPQQPIGAMEGLSDDEVGFRLTIDDD
jgi:hypothetical protein